MKRNERHMALALTALVTGLGATGWATVSAQPAPAAGQPPPLLAVVSGYMPRGGAPSSLSLVPPPPVAGSPAQARDDEVARGAVALRGTPRWDLVTQDADLGFPAAAGTFSCALGVGINEADTPRLYGLLRRSLGDLGLSTYPTKTKYMRSRPFMVNGAPICSPTVEAGLRRDGSYPSGHVAIGWGWALILAEVAPDQAEAILARGRAFGHSRVVCNVHWISDTEEGRTMGAATVAKLHAQTAFRDDIQAARAEVAAARATRLTPTRDCAREAAQMAGG